MLFYLRAKPSTPPPKHIYSHINEFFLDNPTFRELFFSNLILILKKYFLFHNLSHVEKDFFLDIDEKHIHNDDFEFLDNPEFYESDDVINIFHDVFSLISDQTQAIHKKIKSNKNKKFNKFKKIFFNLQKSSNPQNQTDYLSAKTDLKDLLQNIQHSRNEKKRFKKFNLLHKHRPIFFTFWGKKIAGVWPD